MGQDFAQGLAQPFDLWTSDAVGPPTRANACLKEAFVGVDVADPCEQALVKQSRFDRQTAAAEKCRKFILADGEWFIAGRAEWGLATQIAEFEASEPSRIDEAQLTATCKEEPRMSMSREGNFGRSYQQASRHAKMNDPLSARPSRFALVLGRRGAQFSNDVLSRSVNRENRAAGKPLGLARAWRFEGLR